MATILKFKPTRCTGLTPAADCGRAGEAVHGEVVIFPGVRLERQEFRLSDRLPDPGPGKPGIKRRRQTTRK